VVLVGVETWTVDDQVTMDTNAEVTLDNFLQYRKMRINPQHHNDNAQLIT
jgi:hypothetical protein